MPETFQWLRTVDDAIRGEHSRLNADDEVYFWREYTSGKKWDYSDTNQLVNNLKKSPTKPLSELKHKVRAIKECGAYFGKAINPNWIAGATLVPIPCSKAKGHPEYDERMTRVCRQIPSATALDIRNLVVQTASKTAAHLLPAGQRPSVADLIANYTIDETIANPAPTKIGIIDDVLTAGTHFRAMSNVLEARFPNVPIVGFFIARRIFPPMEAADFGFDDIS